MVVPTRKRRRLVRGSGSVKIEPDSDNFSDSEIFNHELPDYEIRKRCPVSVKNLKIESDSDLTGRVSTPRS